MIEKIQVGRTSFVIKGAELFGKYEGDFIENAAQLLPVTLDQLGDNMLGGTHTIQILPELPALAREDVLAAGHRPGAKDALGAIMNGNIPPSDTTIQISYAACEAVVIKTGTGEVVQALGQVAHELHEEARNRIKAAKLWNNGGGTVIWEDPNVPGYEALPDEVLHNQLAAADMTTALGARYEASKYGFRLKH